MDWPLIQDPLVDFMLLEAMGTALPLDRQKDREAIGRYFQPMLESPKTAFLLAVWDTQEDKVRASYVKVTFMIFAKALVL